jgi:hypothetical protein
VPVVAVVVAVVDELLLPELQAASVIPNPATIAPSQNLRMFRPPWSLRSLPTPVILSDSTTVELDEEQDIDPLGAKNLIHVTSPGDLHECGRRAVELPHNAGWAGDFCNCRDTVTPGVAPLG